MAAKSAVHKRNPDRTNTAENTTCPTCGNSINKNFCEVCGEKKLNRHDFSLRHFVEETFEGFTHFDNKFFRTARLLIFKPGQLSIDFYEGRRVPYMKPFPMFIICNILLFMIVGKTNIFSQPLTSFLQYTPYTYFGTKEVILSFVKSDAEFEILATQFNQRMGVEAKAFLAIFIPILALGSWVVNYSRRKYFSEHLVFSTHYFTVMVMLYTVWALLVSRPYTAWFDPEESSRIADRVSGFVSILILAVYFSISSKKFYKISWARSILGSVIITLVFMGSLIAYRTLLFYKIIYSLH
ncbi:DUF3667 domain-containing protein [Daejeonella sp.]|uniref:DUF3667 domain-containing protein n=1 Tax=Daejeonella sp. TaxID=2805397 RepID=UPI0030C46181